MTARGFTAHQIHWTPQVHPYKAPVLLPAGPDDEAAEVTKGGGGAFKTNAKGAAVAAAFARIMDKTRPDDRGLSILSVRSNASTRALRSS